MNTLAAAAYRHELKLAEQLAAGGDLRAAFAHLERAHILGQRSTAAHVRTHWRMLCLGVRLHDRRELIGQIGRILAALMFSKLWVPIGNTGGANVSATRPMPIPEDLRPLIEPSD